MLIGAPAERFWTDPAVFDIDAVRFRMDDMRCLMLKRGFPVQPVCINCFLN